LRILSSRTFIRGENVMNTNGSRKVNVSFMSRGSTLCPGTLLYVQGLYFMSRDSTLCPGTLLYVQGLYFTSRDSNSIANAIVGISKEELFYAVYWMCVTKGTKVLSCSHFPTCYSFNVVRPPRKVRNKINLALILFAFYKNLQQISF